MLVVFILETIFCFAILGKLYFWNLDVFYCYLIAFGMLLVLKFECAEMQRYSKQTFLQDRRLE
jgi:hypothetical protein